MVWKRTPSIGADTRLPRARPRLSSRRERLNSPHRAGRGAVGNQFAIQQSARLDPIATHRSLGNSQRFRRFLLRHPAKKPALHDSGQSFVDGGEMVDCLVQLEQRLSSVAAHGQLVVERDVTMRAAAFLGGPSPGAVHENVPHGHCRHAEKVRAVAPIGAIGPREFEIQLVHERSRGQRVTRSHGELALSDAPELLVNQRQHVIERFAATGSEIREELCDARHIIAPVARAVDCGLLT